MCRVVVHRVENSCLRTFKPAWKQGSQTEQKWGQTGTPCRILDARNCVCLSVWVLAGIVIGDIECVRDSLLPMFCINKVGVYQQGDCT